MRKYLKYLTVASHVARDRAIVLTLITYASVCANANAANGDIGGSVSGICKVSSYLSEYVALAIIAAAVAVYGILYSINAAREGALETVLRVSMGGGLVLSAGAIVTYFYGRSVC